VKDELSDIILAAQAGDRIAEEKIINECRALVRGCARAFFLAGGDSDDLIQEGMIGLLNAIRDYKSDKGNFYAFARLCVNRKLMDAVKGSLRDKHKPLNECLSLETEGENVSAVSEPEIIVIDKENYSALKRKIEEFLTTQELDIWDMYLEGDSYNEIAAALHKDFKAVDNALARIKKKLRKLADVVPSVI
jgi:RNA polymerase sporulation-specific sigma factor